MGMHLVKGSSDYISSVTSPKVHRQMRIQAQITTCFVVLLVIQSQGKYAHTIVPQWGGGAEQQIFYSLFLNKYTLQLDWPEIMILLPQSPIWQKYSHMLPHLTNRKYFRKSCNTSHPQSVSMCGQSELVLLIRQS